MEGLPRDGTKQQRTCITVSPAWRAPAAAAAFLGEADEGNSVEAEAVEAQPLELSSIEASGRARARPGADLELSSAPASDLVRPRDDVAEAAELLHTEALVLPEP